MKKEFLGYVILVNEEATKSNKKHAGMKFRNYVGRDYSHVGDYAFRPYATEKGAENAKKVWEKRFEHPVYKNSGWRYTVGEVIPLTRQNLKQFEAETLENGIKMGLGCWYENRKYVL